MSYTKTQWNNDTAPAINETNLNKIEQGIYDNDSHIGDLSDLETTANTDLVSAINEVNAKDEVKVSTTTPINNSKVWKQYNKNLYNVSIDKVGYIISSTGEETESPDGCITDYIEVEPNTTYTISYDSKDYSYAMRIAEYNSSKTFIQRTYYSDAKITFTTTATTSYIKLSYGVMYVSNIKLEEGSNVVKSEDLILEGNTYEGYDLQKAGNLVVDDIKPKNLFNTALYSTSSTVKVLDSNPGVLNLQGASGYYAGVSALIKVEPNVTYTLSYCAQNKDTSVDTMIRVDIYKLDNTTRIAFNDLTGYQTITFSTSEDGVYIQFRVNGNTNVGKARYSQIQLEKGSTATQYTPYIEFEKTNSGWIDIKDDIITYTSVIPGISTYYAYAKKSGDMTTLKLIFRTSNGIPANSNLSPFAVINNNKYRPKIGFSSFCRTNDNYGYPLWDGNAENIGWCRITENGEIQIREKISGQKAICMDFTF